MTRSESIRRCLLDGPATTAEISTSLQLSRRSVQVGLWVLQTQTEVRVQTGVRVANGSSRGLQIYELTARGRAKARGRGAERRAVMPISPPAHRPLIGQNKKGKP